MCAHSRLCHYHQPSTRRCVVLSPIICPPSRLFAALPEDEKVVALHTSAQHFYFFPHEALRSFYCCSPMSTNSLMATLPHPLRLCGRVGHQPLCWGVSWTTLPGVANDQSTLINNGRLSAFGGIISAGRGFPRHHHESRREPSSVPGEGR